MIYSVDWVKSMLYSCYMNNAIQNNEVAQEITTFLTGYTGNSTFVQSVRSQFLRKGRLSEAQLRVIKEIMTPKVTVQTVPEVQAPREFTLKVGQVVRVGSGYGRTLAEKLNLEAPIFNMEILSVEDERLGSWKVTVKGSGTVNGYCGCCGLPLTDPVSINANIGPVCAKRRGIVRHDSIVMRKIVSTMMERVVSTESFWLSKRMVKEIT